MSALKEITNSILAWKLWIAVGYEDVVGRYRRTSLGPIWIVIGQCVFIFGIYFLHRSLMGDSQLNYLLYLSVSLPLWTLLSQFCVDSCNSLIRSKGFIESYPLPLPIYIIRTVVASVVNFLHLIPIYVLLAFLFPPAIGIGVLTVLPAFALLICFGVGLGLMLACLGTRFRDVGAGVAAAMGLLFVLTPVFWIPNAQQLQSPIVWLNPFYYLMEVFRAPLIGLPPSPTVWAGATLVTIISLVLGLFTYKVMRPTVVYWL